MTLSISTQVSPVGTKLIKDTDADENAKTNVTGAAGTIYMIDINNEANPSDVAYLKIYDNAAPTVGTTDPDFIFKVPVNQRRAIVCPDGLDFAALSFAVVTSAGTPGTTGPTNAVEVEMVTS